MLKGRGTVFDNIFTTNMLGIWENEALLPMRGCSSLVNCCHSTGAFPKLMIMIEHKIKWCKYPILPHESMLLSGQVSNGRNSNHLLWNLEDSVLIQTLSLSIGYHILPVLSINKLISLQDVGHNMLHLHVAPQLHPSP